MSPDPSGEDEVTEPGQTLRVDTSGQRITRVRLAIKRQVVRLNCAKIRFNSDSAIFLPAGLAVIKAVLLHVKEDPERRVLIASHTDTQGSEESNDELSRARSENVRCILLGKPNDWVAANERRNGALAQDVRQVLRWAAQTWAWPCDPGQVGNDPLDGAARDAVAAFKESFKRTFTRRHIPEEEAGEVDEGFWRRVMSLYGRVLVESLGLESARGLGELAGSIQWADPEHPGIGCGQRYPLVATGDGQAEPENRRMEFLFFDALAVPRDGGEGPPEYLEKVYQGKYEFTDLECPKPDFFGEEIPAGNVVFVIDCSGSMSPSDRTGAVVRADRMGRAKRALNLAIDALDEATRFTVVAYSSSVVLANRDEEGRPRVFPPPGRTRTGPWPGSIAGGRRGTPRPARRSMPRSARATSTPASPGPSSCSPTGCPRRRGPG